ncbi:MAG: RNA polymerase sigma factor [Ruminococcaceae bacterium]|nr:RNA polymerase sigma factor [Oscillospiraceae bacterium]
MNLVFLTSINQNSEEPDSELLDLYIDRMARHDKNALAGIYGLTKTSVFGFALSILKNAADAEDVLHDTYLQIYSAVGQYSSKGKPLAWILTITRNLSLMKIRERQKTVGLPPEEWKDSLTMLPNLTPEDRLVLENCIGQLTDEERQIVMLHAVSGFKHRELAKVLALPLSTVLSKYSRAIKKLQLLLTEGEQ